MTIAIGIAVSYVGIVAASCRLFRRLHSCDEEIERMSEDLLLANRIQYKNTGS